MNKFKGKNVDKEVQILFIDIYEENILNSQEYNKIKDLFTVARYSLEKKQKEYLRSKIRILSIEFQNLLRLFFKERNLFRNKLIYLNGLHLSFFLYFKINKNKLKNSKVIVSNLYFHQITLNKYFNIFLKFLFYRKNYNILVQSPNEVDYFKKVGNKLNVVLIPYSMPEIKMNFKVSERNGYFFSGGYTNRDYQLLIDAAKHFPKERFVFVASELNSLTQLKVPNNVEFFFDILPETFNQLIFNSKCVIVPLKDDVGSSGQMLCLAAMQLSKPIIYTDYKVVSQYFKIDNSGIPYTAKQLNSLIEVISSFLKLNKAKMKEIGQNGNLNYKKYFNNEQRITNILKFIKILSN